MGRAGVAIVMVLVCWACRIGAQVADSGARLARMEWLAAEGTEIPGRSPDQLGQRLATVLGIRLSQQLTIDSSIALAIATDARIRKEPWAWFALARQLQASNGSCYPAHQVEANQWFRYCRRVAAAYREALDRHFAFAAVLSDLDLMLPWPLLWGEPEEEQAALAAALNEELPLGVLRRLNRRLLNLEVHVGDPDAARTRLELLDTSIVASGERLFLFGWLAGRAGDGVLAARLIGQAADVDVVGEHLEWIRREIALLGDSTEISTWDSLSAGERGQWLLNFWERRDLADGQPRGHRLAEHTRRWKTAIQDYRFVRGYARLRAVSLGSVPGRNCPSDDEGNVPIAIVIECLLPPSHTRGQTFDDRGRTYIRHGEPQRRANYPGLSHFEAESWLYTTSESSLVIHFARTRPDPLSGMTAGPLAAGDWMSACQVAPLYCVLASRLATGEEIPPERWEQVRERGEEQLVKLLSTDGAPQRFPQPLHFNAAAYGLGEVPGHSTLVVDIPVATLRGLGGEDSSRVNLRWQVRIRSRDGAWPVNSDSIAAVALPPPTPREDGSFATLIREYSLPPGTYDLRVVLSDSAGTTGAMYSRDGMVVFGVGEAGISDIVLMPDPGKGAAREIEGEPVRLSPTFAAGPAHSVALGYVLQGFAGNAVKVTVEISKVDTDDDRTALALAFDEQPARDREFLIRRIGIERLSNGAYDVTVSVPLPDGSFARRTQRMLVRR